MKIVFMGTPEFSVSALIAIIEAHEVVAVISQPDKPVGRGNKLKATPVKEAAEKYGIPVFQPSKIKSAEFTQQLREIKADAFVVVAYGQILSKAILDMPKYGCFNIHASLLPYYRGAAPIQWAVIHNESESGITIIQMDEGMDTGDMIYKISTPISNEDTGGSLHDKLSVLGAEAILKALESVENGTVKRIKQDDSLATYAPMLKKTTGIITWENSTKDIIGLIKGLNPWPSAYSNLDGHGIIKIWQAHAIEFESNEEAGTVVAIIKNKGVVVKIGDGHLLITEIQAQGGKKMPVSSYVLGHEIIVGAKFS